MRRNAWAHSPAGEIKNLYGQTVNWHAHRAGGKIDAAGLREVLPVLRENQVLRAEKGGMAPVAQSICSTVSLADVLKAVLCGLLAAVRP